MSEAIRAAAAPEVRSRVLETFSPAPGRGPEASSGERRVFLSVAPASRRETRFALAAVLASAAVFLVAVPFAKIPLAQVNAFVPAEQSALIICDLITAVLLFGQFNFLRSPSLVVLGGGYLYTALIALVHTLTYPELFSSTGLLGAGLQSTAWLYMFWHGGFPVFVIAYALIKEDAGAAAATGGRALPRGGGAHVVAGVFALACAVTLLATTFHDLLPQLMTGNQLFASKRGIVFGVWGLSLVALAVLWRRRPHSVLDMWLMVVMSAWLFDMGMGAVFNTGRFDFGFYAGRIYGLAAASSLLIVLLAETGAHYARLALLSEELSAANQALELRSVQTAHELRRYRGLLEAAPDAMVVVNQKGDIVMLNLQAETQFGYRRDELLGQSVVNLIPEGFAERMVADRGRSSQEALAQQIGAGVELTGRRKDKSEFPIEIMLSPLTSPEGAVVTAAIRDISARKQAEAELMQKIGELNRSNEELREFAYVASHDLREPLRMVASYVQLLSKRYKGKLDADADEFIAFAVDGTFRMQRLIEDLLAYSRVGSKGGELAATSSQGALDMALRNLGAAIRDSGAVVTHDALPMVMADAAQLTQLFQNLVGNAIKYQNPGVPRVHIGAVADGAGKWTFSVKDNGLGIDPRHFAKIFGMFQRLHKRDEFEGTGIGLAICKKIVERHGGAIAVESEPGHGATFRFALAAAPVPAGAA